MITGMHLIFSTYAQSVNAHTCTSSLCVKWHKSGIITALYIHTDNGLFCHAFFVDSVLQDSVCIPPFPVFCMVDWLAKRSFACQPCVCVRTRARKPAREQICACSHVHNHLHTHIACTSALYATVYNKTIYQCMEVEVIPFISLVTRVGISFHERKVIFLHMTCVWMAWHACLTVDGTPGKLSLGPRKHLEKSFV